MFLHFKNITHTHKEEVGGKAFNLATLYNQGFNIPEGGAIITDAFKQHTKAYNLNEKITQAINGVNNYESAKTAAVVIKKLIVSNSLNKSLFDTVNRFLNELKSKGYLSVAVRSSGVLEDTQYNSFAGQYESFLNIQTPDALENAILHCWASAFNERVLNYCLNHEIPLSKLEVGIVIQGIIPSEYSGVLFTVDPIKGKETVMITEAVAGLGEALVQGIVTPDTYHYDWYNDKLTVINIGKQDKAMFLKKGNSTEWKNIETKEQLLSELQIKNLNSIALQIQEHYGTPQDIEWAFYKEQFYILQSRPITQINYDVEESWTNADFKDGGVASEIPTQFMWSLYEFIWEHSTPTFFKSIHVAPKEMPKKWGESFFGYPYWNLTAVKDGAKKVPGFIERKFDQDLGIEPSYEGDGYVTLFTPKSIINGLVILYSSLKSLKNRPKENAETLKQIQRAIETFNNTQLHNLSDNELIAYSKKTIEQHYKLMETAYFTTIYDNSNAKTFWTEALEKYNKKAKEKLSNLKLISGLENLSHLRSVYDLWDLSRVIKGDLENVKQLKQHTPNQLTVLYNEGKYFPFKEKITAYINTYRHHSLRELDISVTNWIEEPTQVFDTLFSYLDMPDNKNPKIANQKQHNEFLKEFDKIKSTSLKKNINRLRTSLWWREEMRDYSTKMYHVIRMVSIEIAKRLTKKGTIEEINDYFFLPFLQAHELYEGNNNTYLCNLLLKNKSIYKSFRNYNKPNEIGIKRNKGVAKKSANSDLLSGIACAPGFLEAEISVIDNIQHLENLKQGSILVTKFTDPAWTPVFSRISGLITETGGMLSHGAVVSREYGIPAVLAVKDATKTLKSGMKVQIDGDKGEVMVLK